MLCFDFKVESNFCQSKIPLLLFYHYLCPISCTPDNLFFSLLYGPLFLDILHTIDEPQKHCSSNRAGTNCPIENSIFSFELLKVWVVIIKIATHRIMTGWLPSFLGYADIFSQSAIHSAPKKVRYNYAG